MSNKMRPINGAHDGQQASKKLDILKKALNMRVKVMNPKEIMAGMPNLVVGVGSPDGRLMQMPAQLEICLYDEAAQAEVWIPIPFVLSEIAAKVSEQRIAAP